MVILKHFNFKTLQQFSYITSDFDVTSLCHPLLFLNVPKLVVKEYMSDSFTNNNYVGNTKVSVSIKKLMPTNAH